MLYTQKIRLFLQLVIFALLLWGINPFHGPVAGPVIIISIFLLGNFFCGWICIFGTYQELLGKLGSKFIKKKPVINETLDKGLSVFRYLPLLIAIPLIESTLNSRNNAFLAIIYDRPVVQIALYALIFFSFLSIVVERPFCRWLCVKGASYGLLSAGRLTTIKKQPTSCIDCYKCNRVCPMGIDVYKAKEVTDPRCINCLNCVSACPTKKGLSFGVKGFSYFNAILSGLALLYLLYVAGIFN